MFDVREFRVELIRRSDTQKAIADSLHLTEQSIVERTKNRVEWRRSEIEGIIDRWDLTPDRTAEIFFAKGSEKK